MQKQLSIIPASQPEVARQLLAVLDEARRRNGIADNNTLFVDQPPDVQAQVALDMLRLAKQERTTWRISQSFITAYVARFQLWQYHPNGYSSLRQFLRDAGFSSSAVSELSSFGEQVVPYCDANEIPLSAVLTPENWPKLRDALTALKSAIRDDDEELVRDILSDVQKAPGREAIRSKYRKRRTDPLGHATTYTLSDDRVVFIALLNDDDAAEKLVRKIDGALVWDLVPVTTASGELRFENA